MGNPGVAVDVFFMTAVATIAGAPGRHAAPPRDWAAHLRRQAKPLGRHAEPPPSWPSRLSEPMPRIVAVVGVLVLIVVAHARIDRVLGPAVQSATVLTTAALTTNSSSPAAAAATSPVIVPLPLPARHAPRAAAHRATRGAALGRSPARPTCVAVHVVRPGESLWSIAAQNVKEGRQGSITQAWHRIYAANHLQIGDQPNLLAVGTALCLP